MKALRGNWRRVLGWTLLYLAVCVIAGIAKDSVWWGLDLAGFSAIEAIVFACVFFQTDPSIPKTVSDEDRVKGEAIATEFLATNDFARWDRPRKYTKDSMKIAVGIIGLLDEDRKRVLASYVEKKMDVAGRYYEIFYLSFAGMFVSLIVLSPFINSTSVFGIQIPNLQNIISAFLCLWYLQFATTLFLWVFALPRISFVILAAQRDREHLPILLSYAKIGLGETICDALIYFLSLPGDVTDVFSLNELRLMLSNKRISSGSRSKQLAVLLIQRASTVSDPLIINEINRIRKRLIFRSYPEEVKKTVFAALEAQRS